MSSVEQFGEMEIFVTVASKLSFTAAAKHLRLPKTRVSRAVAHLERRLGTRLLERSTRQVILTEPGAFFLARCRAILQQVHDAEQALASSWDEPQGTLTVTAADAELTYALNAALLGVLRKVPALKIEWNTPSPGMAFHRQPNGAQLSPFPRGLYASNLYIASRGMPISPLEIGKHWGLMNGTEGWQAITTPQVRLRAGVEMLLPAALEGLGIAMLPQVAAAPYLATGRLIHILPEWEPPPIPIYAEYTAEAALSPNVRAVMEHLL